MTDQSQLDALIATIQQQRATTDRDTIRKQLVQSGASPQLVDQALAQVYGVEPAVAPIASSSPELQAADVARIREYLEQHKQTYDRDALRKQLIADGHDSQAVDLAITQAYGFQVNAPPVAQPPNRTMFVLTIVGLFLVNLIGWSIITAVVVQSDSAAGLWLIPAMLILEIAAAAGFRQRNRALSRGIAWGIGLSLLPIVTLALLFGICIAIINTLS